MKKLMHLMLSLILTVSVSYSQDIGGQYYVAPPNHPETPGNDNNPGTYEKPFGTWQKGFESARAGDTVYFRGGVWYPKSSYISNKPSESICQIFPRDGYGHHGTFENPICFFNYPGEDPILDGDSVSMRDRSFNTAIQLYWVNYLKFKGLVIRNFYQPRDGSENVAMGLNAWTCSNIIYENITIYNIGGRGFFHLNAFGVPESEGGPVPTPADTTKWINCDVFNCADSLSFREGIFNAADGWKCQNYKGGYFLFEGCRAWNCSDDGIDASGSQLTVIRNCWSFYNGWFGDVLDGNGFKTGGIVDKAVTPSRIFHNNIAAFNYRAGLYDLDYGPFYRNNSRIFNNTFYKNSWGIFGAESNEVDPKYISQFYNNISYKNTDKDPIGRFRNFVVPSMDYKESNNTWDKDLEEFDYWKESDSVSVTDADFFMYEDNIAIEMMKGPRDSIDGSLPDIDFLKLRDGSDLIDKGTSIVGLPYNGEAPDLGAWEFEYQKGSNYTNLAPFVRLLKPEDGSYYESLDDAINLVVNASDPDGTVNKVDFFLNNDDFPIFSLSSRPWSVNWDDASPNVYSIRAKAIDNLGAISSSSPVRIVVSPKINTDLTICTMSSTFNNGKFTLFFSEDIENVSQISIISLEGRIVAEKELPVINQPVNFDLSHLSSGVYILCFSEYEKLSPIKFFKY